MLQPADMEISLQKLPPQNIEAEESLLSVILIGCEQLPEIMDILSPSDFYRTAHQKIFESVSALYKTKNPVDVLSVIDRLKKSNSLEAIGGVSYLYHLMNQVPLAINPIHTAGMIKDKSVLRELIEKSNKIIRLCYKDSDPTNEILDESQKMIMAVQPVGAKDKNSAMICDVMHDAIDLLERQSFAGGEITGLRTGWRDIDKKTSGLQPSDLIIVAARPGMGKTSFACNLLDNVTMGANAAVIFSLEMSKIQIVNRILPRHAKINGAKFRGGIFQPEEWERINSAAAKISDSKLIINDDPDLSYHDIRRLSRKYKKEHDIKLVVVDYLQLVSGDKPKNGSRDLEISSITRHMKSMAKELHLPVVLLSQLNRMVEQRNDKRPALSDLRESGSIEQDADIVAFIYRDEVYHEEPDNPHRGVAEIIFRKFRNGEPGTVRLMWNDKITAFFDLAKRQ